MQLTEIVVTILTSKLQVTTFTFKYYFFQAQLL